MQPVGNYDPNAKVGGTTDFQPTSVEQLEDSPVIAGEYFHEFPLAPEITPKHYIDVVSDDPEDSNLKPDVLAEVSNLVREASSAYASHHYNVYHFLLTLSDVAGGEGLEHGQSSDNGVEEKGFSNPGMRLGNADLLSHEFTHSWNGKYRRPYNLYQPDFHQMQQGSLLWVYEGMTQYLGNVLAARSNLKTPAQYRDLLAMSAASLDNRPGREWRPTEDTAIAASILRGGNPAWANWKRGQDYYQEGELLWLDADTLIRQLTNDQKSLTDFLHIFLAKGGNTGPLIVTYNRQELIDDLNQVVKYDWAKFLHDRIDLINPHADLDGITRGGYKLVYQDHPNDSEKLLAACIPPRRRQPQRLVLPRFARERRRQHRRRALGRPRRPGQTRSRPETHRSQWPHLQRRTDSAMPSTQPIPVARRAKSRFTSSCRPRTTSFPSTSTITTASATPSSFATTVRRTSSTRSPLR